VGSGLFGRGKQIDAALDQVPEIQPARQTYKGMQASRDALDTGAGAMSAMPDDYEASIRDCDRQGDPCRQSASGLRGRHSRGCGHRPPPGHHRRRWLACGGGTGTMSRLVSSPNQIRNQDTSFGPEEAGGFREAVANELSRLRNARLIDPSTRLSDRRDGSTPWTTSKRSPRVRRLAGVACWG
jgi:hypothetical protein